MSNFSYLSTHPEYSLFANSAIEAEKVFSTSPAMCAVGCRKALELAVKWVYAADKTITMPYKDNLQSLLHEPSFRFAVDRNVWSVLPSIVKAGNLAVHTGHSVSAADVLAHQHIVCIALLPQHAVHVIHFVLGAHIGVRPGEFPAHGLEVDVDDLLPRLGFSQVGGGET